jgi:hypothetical protein
MCIQASGFSLMSHSASLTADSQNYCTVGWVDIGTVARVPLKFVVDLKKVGKINQKKFV